VLGSLLPDRVAPAGLSGEARTEARSVRSKASVAHDFMKVSRDLEEALARGAFTACELRIISWLKARTYGVRIKQDEGWVALDAIPITSNFVATDTGLHKSRVKESITSLITDQVLRRKSNGWLGINSRIGDWSRPRAGRDFDFDSRPNPGMGPKHRDKVSPGQGVPVRGGQVVPVRLGQGVPVTPGQVVPPLAGSYKERARVETLEKQRGEGLPPLPGGKNDTPTNRAEAGLADFPPQDHAAFAKLSFKLQDRLADRWETRVAEERKKSSCRKCQTRPRAAEKWPFCRTCTVCAKCGRQAGGGMIYHVTKSEIQCDVCKKKETP
jgi:hypothetical protein